jgi:hypothetical protein
LALALAVPLPGRALTVEAVQDTVRWRPPRLELPAFLSAFPGRSGGVPASVAQLGLKPIPPLVLVELSLPAVVRGGPVPEASRWMVAPGPTLMRRRLALQRMALFEPSPPDRVPRPVSGDPEASLLGGGLADLDVEIVGQAELGGDWTRFRPCDTRVQFSCEPSVLPQLDPDIQFAVRAQGIIAERITLDVDFDQAREFSAANNINIVYDGDEDDILRRVELGDVTFALPASRFLTEGIPAGNFGFLASGQIGPLEFDGVWAQQQGDLSSREFRLSGGPGQENFVQVDTLVLDDADYVRGQFFFLVDPEFIDRGPHIDVLSLDPSSGPVGVSPGAEPVQVYRFETDPVTRQQVEGLIQADGFASKDGDTVEESGWFRFLQPGVDYSVHSSGLWLALRQPLRQDEMLAVTYVTATGDTIGTYNPERVYNEGGRPRLKLLKASRANHRPGRPTWDLEMHQVYRVSSSPDVDPNSVQLTISLGELSAGRTFKRDLGGRDVTFLRLFGLDEESPVDVLDQAGVYKPAMELFQEQPVIPGVFIVFPTLEPFQTPPPVESLRLSDVQAAAILGGDGNATIYEAEDPFLRESGGLYRLTIPFELRSRGVISSFSLGAIGIRDDSERIFLGDRPLSRGTDYDIDYSIGQVTLIQPEVLFATASEPVVRATWEQKSIFQVAPTTVFGLSGRLSAGEVGGFNFLALHQRERTLVNRPQLGVEPAAITLSGLSMDFDFPARGLDRLVESIPFLRVGGPSRIGVEGEVALSFPNPNIRSDVFLDDFDASNELALSLFSYDWLRGSAPGFRGGAEGVFPVALNETDAADLAWQHTWTLPGASQDSVGVFAGFLPEDDIDRQINIQGSQVREIGMLFSFTPHPDAPEAKSWRSITTSLSSTGLDLSKSEFLEFYVAEGDSLSLIIDLGAVAEDALFVDDQGRLNGLKSNGSRWGTGILDHEADPRLGEIWSQEADERGVWLEACQAEPAAVYFPGDSRANCTRGNGRQDTEDMDGDGNLDTLERYLRFVVRLDGSSPFLVRTRAETGTNFQLYRVPLRGVGATEVPGSFSEADFRAVKHMRLTVTGAREQQFILTRMRVVGTHWVKRTESGVMRGIIGDTASFIGRAEVGPVSRVTEGEGYEAPPGVVEELDDLTATFAGRGFEFNEKGLKLQYEDLQSGDRAEVFNRFPQRPRDFLAYRELRLWALARAGDWGPTQPVSFFVKVGEDDENFYLYRTPLTRVVSPDRVAPGDWLPEIVVDFTEWLDLRRRAEEELIVHPRGPNDAPVELWARDSTYAVVLKDRARAPNLAAVRELSLGIWNRLVGPTTGEVWINEMRLSDALRDVGVASHFGVDVEASDVWTTHMTVTSRGALFRQLEDNPTFQADRVFSVNSTLNVERMTPAGWGVEIPLTVSHVQADQDPQFLARSDVRAGSVQNLRETSSRRTRVDVSFRKRTPTANPVVGLLLDGLEARAGYYTVASSSITAEGSSEGVDARLGYGRAVGRRDFAVVPGFLRPVLRWILPEAWEETIVNGRLRWTPERLSLGASYARTDQQALRFDQIVEGPGDSLVQATRSPRESLEGAMEIVFQPFRAVTAQADLVSIRDLLRPDEAVADPQVQDLLDEERSEMLGLDFGWETDQLIRTRMNYEPRLGDWLRANLGWQTYYSSDRNATFVDRNAESGDAVLALQRNVNGQRDFTGQFTIVPVALLGPSSTDSEESGFDRVVRGALAAVDPVSITYQEGITSRFNRDPVDPGYEYRFGFSGMDGYRFLDADTATTLTDRTGWTARSGVRLPAAIQVGVNYRLSEANTLDTRSDRTLKRETWPDVSAAVTSLPLPEDQSLLQRVSLSTGFQRVRQETAYGGTGQQRRFQEDERVPVDVAVVWGGGVSTSYRGSFVKGEGGDPTGDTERTRENHTVSISGAFRPPLGLAERLERPLTTSALVQYTSDRNCRTTAGGSDCVPFLDELIRSLMVRLETTVSRTDLRLQLSYTDRKSFVGLQAGSTQFQFGLFGRFIIADDALLR